MIAKKESSYKNSNLKNKREQRNGARDVGSFKKVNMESSAVMEYLCISRPSTYALIENGMQNFEEGDKKC